MICFFSNVKEGISMKKILLWVLLVTAIITLVACGGEETATKSETSQETPAVSTTTPTTTQKQEVTTPGNPNAIVTDKYTAIPNEFEWKEDSIDMTAFGFVGSGLSAVRQFDAECNGYQKTYCYLDENGKEIVSTKKELQAMGTVGATVTKDDTAKTGKLVVREIVSKVVSSWASVTAKAGSFLMFDFTTNMEAEYCVTVTAKKADASSSAVYTQDAITVKGESGKYVGVAKCTVPKAVGKTYYINICMDDGSKYPVLASIPVTITAPKYESPYSLVYQGDWEQIKDETYLDRLTELFFTVYPRLYARWGTGSETKVVTFIADVNSEHIAYSQGEKVVIQVDYANRKPEDIGWFSHELTHTVEAYGNKMNYTADKKDGYSGWWRENLATYGGFRYFHWGTAAANVQIKDKNKQSFQNWGYDSYGDAQLFFAYMDDKYPTTDKNGDGKITSDEYGLIDAIHFLVKSNTTGSKYYDTPTDTNSPIGKKVAEVTNGKYACIEDLRKDFEKECENDTWDFIGYRDFRDNFLTENIPNLENPDYPMLESVTPGNKTSPVLTSPVLEGENLALKATVIKRSHETNKQPVSFLLDGDLNTYWQGSDLDDYSYHLKGIPQGVVIDLGAEKTFDTYTLVCRGYASSNKAFNAKEWEVLVSNDGKNFTSIDYQNGNKSDIVSVSLGEVKARYIEIRFFTTDQNNTNNVRIQEFMLFDQ